MSTTAFTEAVTQAHDLLRWCSPLRTELWAARLVAAVGSPESVEAHESFAEELAAAGTQEARLTLAALAAVVPDSPYARQETGPLPQWTARMGRVVCEGGWYGKADPYGEQTLAALAFRYENGKEPHLLVVGIDQVHGGLAVDGLVEEPEFLNDLRLAESAREVVAGRVLNAFELADNLMGASVADTLPAIRALALARARAVPDVVRHAPDDALDRFRDLPDLSGLPDPAGAREAFEKLAEFVGDRPLWWSPARVSQFLTSWLPREAILSDAATSAMPDVLRAWTRFCGDQPEVHRRIDADAPALPTLMADDSLAGLAKRLAKAQG
ncbi:hypothetical protein HII36_34250 [Nonomuraea sp. NN258]|uniref:hypothetical protein n=1 Tax=Nonomuraea antri TaxID=2730852 RepID=UPI001569962A|nr:hypothetical protein [Nonomuraea antri]NRQ36865.1 hypothetical protein [Nonomuraea antri]